jgi:hypothetical protein
MIQVGTYPTRSEAEIAKGALESAGIRATVESDDAGGAYPFSFGGVRLLVDEADAEAAAEVLQGAPGEPD